MSRFPRFPLIAAGAVIACAVACDESTDPRLAVISIGTTQSSSSLSITSSTSQINVGSVVQLQTNAPLNLQNQLQWASSQPSVAPVTPTGSVQGIAPGTAVISVRYSFDTTNVATAVIKVNTVAGSGTRIP
ncbi:MAG TPA: Ig-like domain-containing protein [Gemmatimonadaceae bacterium]|jgi:chitodextrinase|nr:Ig-like domain-containing protein [Gemmatimonadaceae bacterium]